MKQPAIYILSNRKHGKIYTGVTSNLVKRVYEHKNETKAGFSKRYECKKLVYYELFETMEEAIKREKQLKSGSRKKKVTLIEDMNPDWFDLYDQII